MLYRFCKFPSTFFSLDITRPFTISLTTYCLPHHSFRKDPPFQCLSNVVSVVRLLIHTYLFSRILISIFRVKGLRLTDFPLMFHVFNQIESQKIKFLFKSLPQSKKFSDYYHSEYHGKSKSKKQKKRGGV